MVWMYLLLVGSAISAGAVNALAGGGTLLTFPALVLALGSTVAANMTSTVSLFPGSVAGAWGFREELAKVWDWVKILTLPSFLGGSLGALCLRWGGEKVFKPLVPWLILAAAVLFLLQPAVARLFRKHAHDGPPSAKTLAAVVGCQFLIGIYGGYFGAGIGILMLSSLSFLGIGNIHQVNALKTFLAFCMNVVSALIFAFTGEVDWNFALVMAAASILGGYFGARLSLKMSPILVRRLVIVIGFGLAFYYFYLHYA